MKNFESLYGFGRRCLKIRDVCMDFEPCFKVHNLVSVHPKIIMLGQMINLDMIFHVVVSVYRLVKIWNSPQVPVEFRNGLITTRAFWTFISENLAPENWSRWHHILKNTVWVEIIITISVKNCTNMGAKIFVILAFPAPPPSQGGKRPWLATRLNFSLHFSGMIRLVD